VKIAPDRLVALIGLVRDGTISVTAAKGVFAEMFETGRAPGEIVRERGLAQISDVEALSRVVEEVIAANPKAVADYLAGKEPVLRFLVGQVMKATRGKANPKLANQLLLEKLGGQNG
ncbi:MAG TPA: Asp-tRNA(Asn)/Glu-tRNA(Gln) amidotransferase GatCAB subunit B, partial [Anaerolineae bacterium]|nr:Asp-tRNA(Asn)/Glu-tRNA(Gln) amidotransferase GatCAB subunit B [Anaerolineae bacterium]